MRYSGVGTLYSSRQILVPSLKHDDVRKAVAAAIRAARKGMRKEASRIQDVWR